MHKELWLFAHFWYGMCANDRQGHRKLRQKGENTMKKAALLTAVIGTMALFGSSAQASDFGHRGYHAELGHREYHRQVYHWDAHRYPMSWGQHRGLHRSLNHDRYHDYQDHGRYHGSRHGFGIHGRNFSIHFGH